MDWISIDPFFWASLIRGKERICKNDFYIYIYIYIERERERERMIIKILFFLYKSGSLYIFDT